MPSCVCSPHACPHPLLQPQHQIRQAEKVLPSSLRGGVISVPSGGTLSPLLTSLASPPFPPASSAHLRGLHWHMPTLIFAGPPPNIPARLAHSPLSSLCSTGTFSGRLPLDYPVQTLTTPDSSHLPPPFLLLI